VAHYFFRVKSFLSYWLEAVDEHSLHSPFFYDLYSRHIKPVDSPEQFRNIEGQRKKLLRDPRTINVRDLGARTKHNRVRKISRIARTSLTSSRYSTIFYRIATACHATCIVELGTSLGINTVYLAAAEKCTVTTFEGAPAVADIAALNFEFAGNKNIQLVAGDIDQTLPEFLNGVSRIDFAFIDANHRYEATVRYFGWLLKKTHENSVVVVDDIHHSPEMQRAWLEIRNHRLVYGSADLFRCGIVFFDPSLNKQHVILQV
jgi:predicted O-methyltransferase YrrM